MPDAAASPKAQAAPAAPVRLDGEHGAAHAGGGAPARPPGLLARLRSVRVRLLALALLPTLIILPAVLALVVTWWTSQFDRLLISKVNGDLTIARQYLNRLMERSDEQLHALGDSVAFDQTVRAGDAAGMEHFLAERRRALGLDFLYLVDDKGARIAMSPEPDGPAGKAGPLWPVERRALAGEASTQIDVFSAAELMRISPELALRAHIDLVPTPGAAPTERAAEGRGMVVQSGTPVRLADGTHGALVGGLLLNQNLDFIDTINDLVYRPGSLPEGSAGTATLFLDDVRISTNVRLFEGRRALGTRVSKEVREAVLGKGRVWLDRAFVVNDWYISAYEPIMDSKGRRVGMLYVGFLEAPFLMLKRASLAAVGIGFLLVAAVAIPVLLHWAAGIFRPLEVMNATISQVEAGALGARTGMNEGTDEIGRVAHHLDTMLDLVQQRDAELRRWTEALDQRVAERTRELEAANAELAATQRQLIMSEKLAAIGEITAGVAHEINNPAAVIQGNLDVAREVLGEAVRPVRTEFNLIDQQVHRITVIVSKLLQFARPGEFAGHLDPVAPGEVVSDALLLVQHLLSRGEITVKREDAARREVLMNRVELQQVLINLMVNAIHAMPEGGTLTVRTRDAAETGKDGVALEVEDTGIGIPPERLARVFDPFFTTKPQGGRQGGTGLGLSISYTLVERAGGHMRVRSTPGQGAHFCFWLPAAMPGAPGASAA